MTDMVGKPPAETADRSLKVTSIAMIQALYVPSGLKTWHNCIEVQSKEEAWDLDATEI